MFNTMGAGRVATRSGFNSDHHGSHQRSLCKKWMMDITAFIKDLTILFWWILPAHAVNMRLYLLILARVVIYTAEATAFYSLTATILAGTEEEVGFLVDLTRLVLCEVSEKMGTRVKREADSWADLVQRVNITRPKMAGILQDLYQTSTRSSLNFLTNVSTGVLELTEINNGTLVTDTGFPTMDGGSFNDSLSLGHNYIITDALELNNVSGLADHISTRNFSGGDLGLGRNITNPTNGFPFSTYSTGKDRSEVTSFLNKHYVFEFCTQVEDLTDNEVTIACVSGLAIPLCIIGAVILTSTACGYMLARVGHMSFRRQRQAPVRVMGNDPLPPLPVDEP